MLQCAAVTGVPFAEALLALATMEGGPEHPPDVLAQDDYLLRDLTTRAAPRARTSTTIPARAPSR
ncbi:hypothetical protein [Streptomyces sp. MMBL 11-1]|uniref:hypothetical protein n=1 Tax=Streptomyces sp. MMBL 11-1 TaxID=3026420 RepID=UPI00235F0F72|nr:hypothetical protein [Streptomyces sp. MMBL 11-1]